jgi:hypothetical protein
MNSGLSRRSITKADKIAGINPYDGKPTNALIFPVDNKLSMFLS